MEGKIIIIGLSPSERDIARRALALLGDARQSVAKQGGFLTNKKGVLNE